MADITIVAAGHGDEIDFLDFVDRSVPYVRMAKLVLEDSDRGVWRGLKPAEIEFLKPCHGDRPGKVRVQHPGDGEVRGRLVDLGVHRHSWEAASTATRRRVIRASRALVYIESAIARAVSTEDRDLLDAAERILESVADLVVADSKNPRGFSKRKQKLDGQRLPRLLLENLERVLVSIKREAASHRSAISSGKNWLSAKAAEANRVLASNPVFPLPPACTTSMISSLKVSSPKKIALEILAAADPSLSKDDLRRKEPLVRRRRPPR